MKTVFTEDLENNRLIAERTLNASVEKVWEAWKDPEILCQWWAPQPYICKISFMDFKEGGYWMYNMIGPEGDEHRGRMDFHKITEFNLIEADDYFCDEEGQPIGEMEPMQFKAEFNSDGNSTTIKTITTFASAETMKQMAEMGMAEGWELAMNQLQDLL